LAQITGGGSIALLLVNTILDLGIPDKNCKYNTIYENIKVKRFDLKLILNKIHKMTEEHRQGKNLLLHRGQVIPTPTKVKYEIDLDIAKLAKSLNIDETEVTENLKEFLLYNDKNDLISKMGSEIIQLEKHFLILFDKLLPIYKANHSIYKSKYSVRLN